MTCTTDQPPGNLPSSGPARFCRMQKGLVFDGDLIFPLRNQSLKVLELLAEHEGEVLSKEYILSSVWPRTAVTDDSLVQCISEIRKVLSDNHRTILKTYPRRGYLLTESAFVARENANIHPIDEKTLQRFTRVIYHRCGTFLAGIRTLGQFRVLLPTWKICLATAVSLSFVAVLFFHDSGGLSRPAVTSKFDGTTENVMTNSEFEKNSSRPIVEPILALKQGKDTLQRMVTAGVSKRDYKNHGMPYWNNRFLWDGYYEEVRLKRQIDRQRQEHTHLSSIYVPDSR